MPKLQRIKRSNGSVVFSVNIPLEIIEELCWEKGADLIITWTNIGDKDIMIIEKEETNG
ncbi:hypothetical protein LCGC14_1694000 [marine sediment metagenome]|uniref:SpoVT-AbrB domain-containing protein n=1 Tax=marine sediment metagenome TaxID=412755 RepID=A0A0F9HK00_9ZZZZ